MTEIQLSDLAMTRAIFTGAAWLAGFFLLIFLVYLKRWNEPLHHGYYGLILVAAGNLIAASRPMLGTVFVVVGSILVVEDTGQHGEQAFRWRRSMPKLTGADDTWPIHRGTYWLLGKLGLHG